MFEEPFFSIIVPVYNSEKYLNRCIKSILNQTFNDYELILIDDGSEDGSINICKEYSSHDNRIKLIVHPQNLGVVAARDSGLKASTGKYVTWVDSDDYVDPCRLEKIYNEIQITSADIVITGYIHEFSDGRKKPFKDVYFGQLITGNDYENLKPHLFEFNNKTGMRNIHTILWNKAFKRKLLMLTYQRIPNSIVIGDDTPRTYTAMLAADSASFIEDFSYHYMENPGQLMKSGYRSDYFENALRIYLLINELNDKLHLSVQDISYEISQNILIIAVFAIAKERNNPSITSRNENLKKICENRILLSHISKEIIRKQNLYFRFVLNQILNKRYKVIKIYLHLYKKLIG